MFDILNRYIEEGDLVVVKGNGGGFEHGRQKEMEVGIRIGKSIQTLTCCRNPRDKFKIVNPTPEEIAIKDKILKMRDEKSKKTREKSAKSKATDVGGIYLMSKYKEVFLYLGNVNIKVYNDGILSVEETGKCYVSLKSWADPAKFKTIDFAQVLDILPSRSTSFNGFSSSYEFIKTSKVYEEHLTTIELPDTFSFEFENKCYVNGEQPVKKKKYVITRI